MVKGRRGRIRRPSSRQDGLSMGVSRTRTIGSSLESFSHVPRLMSVWLAISYRLLRRCWFTWSSHLSMKTFIIISSLLSWNSRSRTSEPSNWKIKISSKIRKTLNSKPSFSKRVCMVTTEYDSFLFRAHTSRTFFANSSSIGCGIQPRKRLNLGTLLYLAHAWTVCAYRLAQRMSQLPMGTLRVPASK